MNNDLEQFSEERLKKMIFLEGLGCAVYKTNEVAALARIALAVKQAKPVGYTAMSELKNTEATGLYFKAWPKDNHAGYSTAVYLTPQPAHTEQDGWKLVPEEATIAMLTLLGMTGSFEFMQQKYKNMLAAAPKPESE